MNCKLLRCSEWFIVQYVARVFSYCLVFVVLSILANIIKHVTVFLLGYGDYDRLRRQSPSDVDWEGHRLLF